MSRKGKLPIPLPKEIEVKVDASEIFVKGPKGALQQKIMPGIEIQMHGDHLLVLLRKGAESQKNFHGLYRTLIYNMVEGAAKGFEKKLEMIGVGYRASVQGRELDLQVGFSHPTRVPIPQGIQVAVEKGTIIAISGADKQLVGQFAASVRALKKPEPYQGKGIRYEGEYVRRKAGKSAAKK